MPTLRKFYEEAYCDLVQDVLQNGSIRSCRNGSVLGVFGRTLVVDCLLKKQFPLLHGRKMYPKGVIGEFYAFMHRPKTVEDFTEFDCNYWGQWADKDGNLELDYGNAWFDFNGVNQFENLLEGLRKDPYGRRHIITAWNPERLPHLSLPCCHLLYQFYVNNDGTLDIIWYQRSVDLMVGLPSDVILAALFVLYVSAAVGLKPGKLHMHLADTHIYAEHIDKAREYLNAARNVQHQVCHYFYAHGSRTPEDISISDYYPLQPIKFEVKA